jgi:hypothetical protein
MGQLMAQYGGDLPGEGAYYDAIQQRQNSALFSGLQNQQRSGLNAIESRGLGQSSLVGNLAGQIGSAYGQGSSDIAASILGNRFRAREGRIGDALGFERQKTGQYIAAGLQADLNKKSPLDYIADFASVGAQFLPLGNGGQRPATSSPYVQNQIQNAGPSGVRGGQLGYGYQQGYDPWHNRPMG